jgi:hypothetical protein
MKCLCATIFLSSIILCACNNNNKQEEQIVAAGGLDSAAIAQDTMMQKSIDNSYEFAATLDISPALAYDIRAFGGPASKGGFAIIRRGVGNKPDTVAQGMRYGTIVNTFSADLNNDQQQEIYIVIRSADGGLYEDIIAYQFDDKGGATGLILPPVAPEEKAKGYGGHDSVYVENNYLIRQFKRYKKDDRACCPTGETDKIYYRLEKNIFVKQKDNSVQ